jgi:hypothetical protein
MVTDPGTTNSIGAARPALLACFVFLAQSSVFLHSDSYLVSPLRFPIHSDTLCAASATNGDEVTETIQQLRLGISGWMRWMCRCALLQAFSAVFLLWYKGQERRPRQ